MKPDSDPRLPRSPKAPDNLLRLRQEALRRLEGEERASNAEPGPEPTHIEAITVYGGPPPANNRPDPEYDEPAPVYGGPPPFGGGGSMTRRRTLWALLVAALAVIAAMIAWLLKRRKNDPPRIIDTLQQATMYGGPPTPPPTPPNDAEQAPRTLTGAIKTTSGHFLAAEDGGGLGDPNSALHGVALASGATTAGPFETFTFIWVNKSARTFALKTSDGHFVMAVKGGDAGESDDHHLPIRADSTLGPTGTFTVILLPDNIHATIRTPDHNHYLSAVNGGGVGGSSEMPIRTDATKMGADAVFQLVPPYPVDIFQPPSPRQPPAPVYGGPPRRPGS